MMWEAKPTGRCGRLRKFSDASIQVCLTLKVPFGMALQHRTGFVERLLHLIGPD